MPLRRQSAGLGNRARGVRSRAQRSQARVLEEHVLQNVAANLVHDPGRSASVEEGHGVEIGGSEGDADMAYAVGVAASAEGQAVLSANEGGRASQRDKGSRGVAPRWSWGQSNQSFLPSSLVSSLLVGFDAGTLPLPRARCPLVALTPSEDLFVHARDLFV